MNPRRLCGVARGGYFSYSPRDIQKKKKNFGTSTIHCSRTRSHNDNVTAKWGGLIAVSRSVSRRTLFVYFVFFCLICSKDNIARKPGFVRKYNVHAFTKIFASVYASLDFV